MDLNVSAQDIVNILRSECLARGVDDRITADFERLAANDPELQASAGVIFMASPKASDNYFRDNGNNPTHAIELLCNSVSILCRKYIAMNIDTVQELNKCVSDFSVAKIGENCLIAGDKNLSAENEKAYLANAKSIAETKKRMKVLAALDIMRKSIDLSDQVSASKDQTSLYAMFSYVRSMAQFLFFEYYADGISMQIKREAGARKPADRTGVRLLVDEVRQTTTQAATKNSVAWRAIKKDLLANGLRTFDNEYGVEFESDEASTSPYSGYIQQIDPDGKKYKMSYEAFKAYFRQVKKEGRS